MDTTSSTGMVRIVGYVQSIPVRWEARWPDPKSLDAHRSFRSVCTVEPTKCRGRSGRVPTRMDQGLGHGIVLPSSRGYGLVGIGRLRWMASLVPFQRESPSGGKRELPFWKGGSWRVVGSSRGETTVRRRRWRMADTDQADRQTDTNACERNTGHVHRHLDHLHPPCQDQVEDQDRTVRHRRGPWRLLTADHPPHLHQP